MTKEAVFTMKLEPDLRAAFLAEAAAEDRPASQIARELMRAYIEERRRSREYDAFVQAKIDKARSSARAGASRSNAEVAAEFAARRAQVVR
ncbi:antitoxin of toxin-antitoxin stability system [Marinivivus vitaminiproducens]|uniref:antitoxin of toxin-antitoxin stability system n=1 Tax=Marinivivus vitaminiproducens TaxID=3035935 RepID=UPI00279E8C2F|nr:antitoxin of toxin-antitoxin stability system [Geminicoccaceae bacterium SCSIO 64248]